MCADSKNTALDIGAVAGGEESLLLSSQGGTGGSQTRRWREQDSNPRFRLGEELEYEISRQDPETGPRRGAASSDPFINGRADRQYCGT